MSRIGLQFRCDCKQLSVPEYKNDTDSANSICTVTKAVIASLINDSIRGKVREPFAVMLFFIIVIHDYRWKLSEINMREINTSQEDQTGR